MTPPNVTEPRGSAAGTDVPPELPEVKKNNFLRQIVREDLAGTGERQKVNGLVTRFPPEPNGYLHVGHAKSICLNFGLAEEFNGNCHLRFDDTNPEKESAEYIKSIQEDVQWLGFDWHGDVRFASDYFQQLHDYAVYLIEQDKAYVCDLNAEQAREYRGTLTEPGRNSPHRDRTVAENKDLFEKMVGGEFEDGACVLRAKIDMASPNINMRDPIIYRIRKVTHHQTGDKWCVYPTYDFTHGQSDAIEGISHSICTLEFEDHKPLYNWFVENLPVPNEPRQYEFSRLNLNYTVTSKRKLKQLVDDGAVSGWDDPRMPTISGMRRRGYAPESIRNFCEAIGVTRVNGVVDVAMLEFEVREHHNHNAPRAMVVMNPLKVIITNYPAGETEILKGANHPQREEMGQRDLAFSREIYIDAEDFREAANKKFKRLVIGKKVRLRNGYVIYAESCTKDDAGNVIEVQATFDAKTLGCDPEDGVKPKGVIQWVEADSAINLTVNCYDRLFTESDPEKFMSGTDELRDGLNTESGFMACINPDSLVAVQALGEASLGSAQAEQVFQFEREGYFVADRYDYSASTPVFNKTIGLRDTWAKVEQR